MTQKYPSIGFCQHEGPTKFCLRTDDHVQTCIHCGHVEITNTKIALVLEFAQARLQR